MDGNSGAMGRGIGGRGYLLRQRLEQRKLQQQQQQSRGLVGQGDAVAAAALALPSQEPEPQMPQPQPAASGGRGQKLLALIRRASEKSQGAALPSIESPTPSTSRSAVGGRGKIKEFLASKAESPGKQSDSSGDSVTSKLSTLSVDNYKPAPDLRGKSGTPIGVTANYIRLAVAGDRGIFEYEVKFSGQIDNLQERFQLIRQHRDSLGNARSFDGSAVMYLDQRLPENDSHFQCTRADGDIVTLTLTYRRERSLSECIHMYNLLFSRIFRILKHVRIGRNYYSQQGSKDISQHKLELWPGYVTAVNEYEGGLMLCCEVSHRVLRTETVLQVLRDLPQDHHFHKAAENAIVGSTVITRYNNMTYRIDEILWDKSPMSTFPTREREISYMEYYKNSYNKDIRDKSQPLLLHRRRKRERGKEDAIEYICLVPELCHMTGLTEQMKSNRRIMKDLATYTKPSPNQRLGALKALVKNINENAEARAVLEAWGLSLQPGTVEFAGRVIRQQTVTIGRNTTISDYKASSWSSQLVRSEVLHPVDVYKWVIVCMDKNRNIVDNYVKTTIEISKHMGIRYSHPTILITKPSVADFVKTVQNALTPDLQIVVVVMQTAREDLYNAVKKFLCVTQPYASQFIIAKTISEDRKLRSVAQKIALQVNCKLGGSLWTVEIPFRVKSMVIGIDVYHEGANRSSPSVAGLVCSMNKEMSSWYSQAAFHMIGQELMNSLKLNVAASLGQFKKHNGAYPDHIIVYRDGVGDGNLDAVAGYESQQLREAFKLIGDTYTPQLTVIVVSKRINTRIFHAMNGGDRGNPPPGTVVDTTIVRKDWFDFLLVSQHVNEGTVSPTHYIVVHNTCGALVPDMVESLSYKLTYMYYNWPGTIRVPSPCQYAHKLAYLVGQNIHKVPAGLLNDRLYYL